MYDGLRRIPIHKARDIGKQYPPCAVVTRYISPLCRPLSPPFFYPLLAPFLSVLSLRPLRPTSSTFRWERAQAPQRQVAGEQTRGRCAKLRAIYGGFSRSPLCARVSLPKCSARFWDIDHPCVSPFSTTHGDRPENELTYGPRTDSRKFVSRRSLSTHTLKTRIRYQQDHSNVYEAHTFGQAWIVRLQWCAKR